jgi:[protein-PII] uridylyltransferase
VIGPSIDVYLDPSSEAASGAQADRAVPGAVREYLAAVRAYLGEIHEEGASGRSVNEAHSDLIDRLLRRLFELSEELFFDDGGEQAPEFCVVAVGGYARREMSIHSDVDVLFLYDDKVTPYVTAVTERLQRWLWDSQVMVGGATRTISETIQLARQDPTVCTGVLAPRFLVGSGVLFHRFDETLHRRLLSRPERFISGQIESVRERHAEYGETLYLLQPNVKESAGGLRDYHASYWAMQASQSSARGGNDFLHLGLLTEAEAKAYFEALDFLWRVRNELHLRAGRKHDQLSFDQQEHVATAFGYAEGDPATSDLPVERFMRDYYIHARNVLNYSSLVMEQCLARVRRAPLLRRVQKAERGLRIVQGQLEIPHRRQIRDDPLLLLDVFAVAAQRDVPLTRKARRMVRENLHRIDDAFRSSPQAAASFLRILRAEHRVSRSLIAMNEVGLLARYLPEWDHIVCRWQHVMYHTYTVDVHSIFLVEELRRLRKGDYAEELPDLTERMRAVEDPTAVYLGCLLHDVGKGFGGNHSQKGAALARRCLERLGLDAELVDRVEFLVAQHLLMSHLAQRRDLSDPKLIFDFARLVGDRENLRNLYLLTVADMRASSRSAWTDWKGRLLRDLFEKTAELLETGADGPDRAIELVERRVETRRGAATEELRRQGVPEAAIADYFETMPRRYLTAHSPSQIARHARVVFDFGPDQVVATAVRERRGGFSELILCARDVHGLYSNVAGVLTAHHMNILGAHVYTSSSGLALEIYRVATPPGGEGERAIAWKEFQTSLERVLRGEISVDELLRRRGRPVGVQESLVSGKPESVSITNDESDFYTIVDVAANDRLGLLHDLTRVIADNGLEVYISKAGRVLDQVTDAFYVKDAEGSKVYDAALLEKLRRELLVAARPDAGRAGG